MNVLEEAQKLVDGDRADVYGKPDRCLSRTAEIFKIISGNDFSTHEVALFNIAQKLARLSQSYKRDTVVDICGYLYILADKLKEDK